MVHWGVLGKTGAPHEESEEGPCRLGGWMSELGKETSEIFSVIG